ncbi:MAG: phosphatase PAP2 family protein [Pseudomonadota bacterium]
MPFTSLENHENHENWENHENHENHENWANHENHENHEGGGRRGVSGRLSAALQSAGEGITGPFNTALIRDVALGTHTPGDLFTSVPRNHLSLLLLRALGGHLMTRFENGAAVVSSDGEIIATVTAPADIEPFKAQLTRVHQDGDLRNDRSSEILTQVNDLLSFFAASVRLDPRRRKWTIKLLVTALEAAQPVTVQVKAICAVPRPVDLSPQINPLIDTPGHSAYPSGHATQAFLLAEIMATLDPTGATIYRRQAARIAQNRTVAGVHYPVDSRAGALVGSALAHQFLGRLAPSLITEGKAWTAVSVPAPTASDANYDFNVLSLDNEHGNTLAALRNADPAGPEVNAYDRALLDELWHRIRAEWPGLAEAKA